jgi:hypothetical protein
MQMTPRREWAMKLGETIQSLNEMVNKWEADLPSELMHATDPLYQKRGAFGEGGRGPSAVGGRRLSDVLALRAAIADLTELQREADPPKLSAREAFRLAH